ncbi:MAG: RNase adapter RapZ [Deltaproteobacteria bacterium]
MYIVILSGLSGSGKSTALKALEDLGYFCVDNLPATLVPTFTELCTSSADKISKIGIGMDIREGVFIDSAPEQIRELKKKDYVVEILFLEAPDEVLVRRYKETRRRHPLSKGSNILEGIAKERESIAPIKELADRIIDTSSMNVHQLREFIRDTFDAKIVSRKMSVNFLSFGYKYGFPYDADLVFDVRFLPSPHFVEELKDLTGEDEEVREYVLSNADADIFLSKLIDFLEFLMPRYEKEGKSYLTVAIGCSGGRHRSVAITNQIGLNFKSLSPNIWHRDIKKA